MGTEAEISIAQKISAAQVAETLKILDQFDPVQGEQSPEDERLPYLHPNVKLVITHPGGGFGKCYTYTRYLSPTRLSVLSKVYMHEGSKVHIQMPDKLGMPEDQEGTITQCNYIYNSMHEVKILLKHRVNLRLFMDPPAHFAIDAEEEIDPEQISGRMLIYSDDKADVRLIQHYLRKSRVQITEADSLGALLDVVRSKPFDIVLCGDMVQGLGVDRIHAALTEAGCTSDVMAICPVGDVLANLEAAGEVLCLSKPLHEPSVIAKFADLMGNGAGGESDCLYSDLPQDEQNAELVDWYIDHVKCLVHSLQKAVMADAIEDAKRYIMTLRDTGSSYGFRPISEMASELIKAINASGSITECRDKVRWCLDLTRRMRSMS